jgi:hypothetical protein
MNECSISPHVKAGEVRIDRAPFERALFVEPAGAEENQPRVLQNMGRDRVASLSVASSAPAESPDLLSAHARVSHASRSFDRDRDAPFDRLFAFSCESE